MVRLAKAHDFTKGAIKMIKTSNWPWFLKWIALTTIALLAAFLLMAPFSAVLLMIVNQLGDLSIIEGYEPDLLNFVGFIIAFSFTLSAAQWQLLRKVLPNARGWFWATAAGLFLGGLTAGAIIFTLSDSLSLNSWQAVVYLLPVGSVIGIAQWLVLRRLLPNAFWIILIDIAATCSILLAGRAITSIPELLVFLILPGGITGLGIWLLLRKNQPEGDEAHQESNDTTGKRPLPAVRIGLGLTAMVPTFFLCSWIYAASQLTLAKNEGIYPTVEQAIIQKNSRDWGGAQVVSIEDVRASVNQHDGSQPHVWFGGARVTLDRVPQGRDRNEYSSGSYFLHVREGWVHVPEGAFPEFIGWVMELYDMEGVHEWIAQNG
jgi:hypothetical protein